MQIEGVCRHLVRDRLDCCGARWSVIGAEAIVAFRRGAEDLHEKARVHQGGALWVLFASPQTPLASR